MAHLHTASTPFRTAVVALAGTALLAGPPHFTGGMRAAPGGSARIAPGATLRAAPGGRVYGSVRVLPPGAVTYNHLGGTYHMSGGLWYRPWRRGYYGCYPPFGLYLPLLPLGFATCWFGGVRYYAYEDVYYMDAPQGGGYVVAEPPAEARQPAQPAPGSIDAAALDALLVTPKDGQSLEKTKADRLAAQQHAIRASGYDPANSDPNDPGTPRARRAYLKAMKAYLEARGYSVD